MKQQKFSIKKRWDSLKFAFNGLVILFKEEHNARIHFVVAVCAIIAGFVLKISPYEWISIIFAIGFVIALEAVNSAIENMADFVSPAKDERIKRIKDLSAAGVLIGAVAALAAGLIVFVPKIIQFMFFR
jgi:diacylglycerol kinase